MQRFGFVTCVKLGLSCMEAIYSAGGRLELAITLQDDAAPNKSGRTYLDEFCRRHVIPLTKVKNVNDPESVAAIRASNLDWLFIVGWSQIARDDVLASVRRGVLGMHPTFLPEGRGRAAIPWAILKGLERTGVTLFQLDAGVDSGPILGQIEISIDRNETATTLYSKVEAAHSSLLHRMWPSLATGGVRAYDQDPSKATTWPGRKPEDGRLTSDMTVSQAERLVRAVTRPYPGAFVDYAWGRVVVWRATPKQGCRSAVPDGVGALRADPVLPFRDGSLRLEDFEILEAGPKLGA